MSRTSAALASSTSSGARVSPTMASRTGIALMVELALSCGYSRATELEMTAMSRRAASAVTPGLSRTTAPRKWRRRMPTGSRMAPRKFIAK
ncbi:MAG TPA: hypothetical protein VM076_02315 [Gemmatimonadaceae bacterium]|nr:hypothetical protein [Gemmatimonadaceae bacterium]